jgi:hypothetical protein
LTVPEVEIAAGQFEHVEVPMPLFQVMETTGCGLKGRRRHRVVNRLWKRSARSAHRMNAASRFERLT